MQKLDLTREHAAIIGDSFGPMPFKFIRTGFDWTNSVITFEVFRVDLAAPIFTKVLPWTETTPGTIEFNVHLTPEETSTIRQGGYKYKVQITWPNGSDKNSIIGGHLQFNSL